MDFVSKEQREKQETGRIEDIMKFFFSTLILLLLFSFAAQAVIQKKPIKGFNPLLRNTTLNVVGPDADVIVFVRKGDKVPLAVGRWYDLNEFGCHLGIVGQIMRAFPIRNCQFDFGPWHIPVGWLRLGMKGENSARRPIGVSNG